MVKGDFDSLTSKLDCMQVKVHQQGFADVTRSVTLTVGAAFDLPISLAVESAKETVTVNGEAAAIETTRTQIAGTVIQNEINNLPLNGRSFLDLTLLVPGVSLTNTASTQLFAETSAVPGQGISIGSQRNFSNSFIVDGLSANDDAAGLVLTTYGLDVVQEFQVVTSGGKRSSGALWAATSIWSPRAARTTFMARLYGFFRNQSSERSQCADARQVAHHSGCNTARVLVVQSSKTELFISRTLSSGYLTKRAVPSSPSRLQTWPRSTHGLQRWAT